MMVKIIGAGGHGEVWVNFDQACHAMAPSIRKLVLASLVKKGWAQEIGGMVKSTDEGLIALERV